MIVLTVVLVCLIIVIVFIAVTYKRSQRKHDSVPLVYNEQIDPISTGSISPVVFDGVSNNDLYSTDSMDHIYDVPSDAPHKYEHPVTFSGYADIECDPPASTDNHSEVFYDNTIGSPPSDESSTPAPIIVYDAPSFVESKGDPMPSVPYDKASPGSHIDIDETPVLYDNPPPKPHEDDQFTPVLYDNPPSADVSSDFGVYDNQTDVDIIRSETLVPNIHVESVGSMRIITNEFYDTHDVQQFRDEHTYAQVEPPDIRDE